MTKQALDKENKTFLLEYGDNHDAQFALYNYAIFCNDVELRQELLQELHDSDFEIPERMKEGYNIG